MSYQSNRQSMILPLGISAIDVLCCAMVASFVLFLVLSPPPSNRGRATSKGKSSSKMQVRLTVFDATTVLGLKLIPPASVGEAEMIPTSLWTDEPANDRISRGAPDRKPAIAKEGAWSWVVLPSWGESVLILEQPFKGQWGADLSYAHGPSLEDVKVNIQVIGSCMFTRDVTLKPGETVNVNTLGADQVCSAQKSMNLSF